MRDLCSSARDWIHTSRIGRQVLTSALPGKSSNLFNIGICLLRSYSLRPRVPPGPNIWSRNSIEKKIFLYILRYWENSDLCMTAHLWAKLLQLCPTLWDSMDCSPPASPVCGILQARILEWVVTPFSRGSSWPRDQTLISYISCTGGWILSLSHQGSPSFWLSILNTAVVSWLLHVISSFPCCPFSVSSSNYWDWPPGLALWLSRGLFSIFLSELSWVCRGGCDGGGVAFMLVYFLVYFLKFIS